MECPHVKQYIQITPVNFELYVCTDCKSEEDLWQCVDCGDVRCGPYMKDHAREHYERVKHCLSVDYQTLGVFCYLCDGYIANHYGNQRCPLKSLNAQRSNSDSWNRLEGSSGLENKDAKPNIFRKGWRDGRGCNQIKANMDDQFFTKNTRKRTGNIISDRFSTSPCDLNNSRSEKKPKLIGKRMNVHENKDRRQQDPKSITKSFESILENFIQKAIEASKGNSESIRSSLAKKNDALQSNTSISYTNNLKHLGVVGLRNLGNTCFMNSVLQSLSKIRGFTFYMTNIPPLDQLRLKSIDGSNGILPNEFAYSTHSGKDVYSSSKKSKLIRTSTSISSFTSDSNVGENKAPVSAFKSAATERRGIKTEKFLTDELRKILISLDTSGSSAVSPDALLAIICEVMPAFKGHRQHDAHEFLRYILDRIHTELVLLIPTFSWNGNDISKGQNSIVTSVFGGTLQNEIRCSYCGIESKTQDPFLDLSLDIPCTSGISKLEDCLSRFVDIEELGDQYFCSNCKAQRKSTKRFWIEQLPNVLCLHLKRFRWANGARTKLDQYVQFPLTSLDMSDYLSKNLHGRAESSGSNLYDLSAVIVHYGAGFEFGHYSTFAKKNSQWYHFNDSVVKPVEATLMARCKAYILFYTRQGFEP